jgi:hypothetical protein
MFKAYRLEFTPQDTPRLEELEKLVLDEAHTRVVEAVSDVAGRRGAPAQRNWGAPLGDDHNLQLESRRRLIREIADHLERLIQRSDCPACWLAAPKEILHQILDHLAPAIRNRIKRIISCNLTKAGQEDLLAQFLNPNSWTTPR